MGHSNENMQKALKYNIEKQLTVLTTLNIENDICFVGGYTQERGLMSQNNRTSSTPYYIKVYVDHLIDFLEGYPNSIRQNLVNLLMHELHHYIHEHKDNHSTDHAYIINYVKNDRE